MSERDGDAWGRMFDDLPAALRRFGFDIAAPHRNDPPGRSLVARLDLGERVLLLAMDAGGRFRIEVTWRGDEESSWDEIAGVPVRVVDTVSHVLTISGAATAPEQMRRIVAALGILAAGAGSPLAEPPQRADENEAG